MDIVSGVAAFKSGFEVAKSIGELVKQEHIDANEIASRLLLLKSLMLDSQSALNDAQEEQRRLKEELAAGNWIKEIEADLEMVPDGQFYVRKSEKAKGQCIPYCPACWGDAHKLVPLNAQGNRGMFRCDIHKSAYETEAYRNWRRQQRPVGRGGGGTPWS